MVNCTMPLKWYLLISFMIKIYIANGFTFNEILIYKKKFTHFFHNIGMDYQLK